MKTARPGRNLAGLLGSALAMLLCMPSDGEESAFGYCATAPLHPIAIRTSPAAAKSGATGPGEHGSSRFCRVSDGMAERRYRRRRRGAITGTTAAKRNGGGDGRSPGFGRVGTIPGMRMSFVGRSRRDISANALEAGRTDCEGDGDGKDIHGGAGQSPPPNHPHTSPSSPSPHTHPPGDAPSSFVSPADVPRASGVADEMTSTSTTTAAASPSGRPNYSSFTGRTSVMRESAVVVDWDPVSELERRVDRGASYEHWPEYSTNVHVHRGWGEERGESVGDSSSMGTVDRSVPGGMIGDGSRRSGCTDDADKENDDADIPVKRGVFCGFRVTAEERRRLRSANVDDDVDAESVHGI